MRLSHRAVAGLKVLAFAACLAPFAWLATFAVVDPAALGANPAEHIVRSTGDWCLRLLLATLALTPLRHWTGSALWLRFRRMLGLFAFFYAAVHFASYVAFDHVFDIAAILADIVKRPFITVGFVALLLLVPLAATSTHAMVRRLGGRRWSLLHRAVYAIAVLAVVHFWMMVKRDITEPLIYALILALLLGSRWRQIRRGRAAA